MSRTYHKLKESHKRGGKSVSYGCRNNGSCDWCLGNRLHKHNKKSANIQDLSYIDSSPT